MSPRRTECAANSDFARAFSHAREHDVHDSDSAHEQADCGDRDQHDIPDEHRATSIFKQFPGHDDLHIGQSRMPRFHDSLDALRDLIDSLGGRRRHINLTELNLFGAECARGAPLNNIAKLPLSR